MPEIVACTSENFMEIIDWPEYHEGMSEIKMTNQQKMDISSDWNEDHPTVEVKLISEGVYTFVRDGDYLGYPYFEEKSDA